MEEKGGGMLREDDKKFLHSDSYIAKKFADLDLR